MSLSTRDVDRLRVLMVNTHQTGGGAGRVGELLAEALRVEGDAVHAFVRSDPVGCPHCRAAGHWRDTGLAAWLARQGLTDLGHLSAFFWRFRPEFAAADVLHWHNLHGDYVSLAALPLWGLDKPIVWTLHDFWPLTGNCAAPGTCTRWRQSCGHCPQLGTYPLGDVDRSRFYRWLKPRLFATARPRLVTPSRWLGERVGELSELRGLPRRVIRAPIDCDVFVPRENVAALRRTFGLAADRFTIVLSGNNWADRLKGADDAVAALRAAGAAVRELQLLVVGRGSEQLLAQTGLLGQARPFFDLRERLADAYACADVCLFPSRAENYPLTVLEALACGTPVVAYAVGGIPEQVEHRRTGFLAREGQSDELTAGIVALARRPAAARTMGRLGRMFVVRTSAAPVIAAQYRDEYRRAIRAWCRRRWRGSPKTDRGWFGRAAARALGWAVSGADCVAPSKTRAGLPTRAPACERGMEAVSADCGFSYAEAEAS